VGLKNDKISRGHTPLISFNNTATLAFSVGCNMGPITLPGFKATMSIPFSLENRQAASSAKVFETAYHICHSTKQFKSHELNREYE